jgi:hypothetical protein
VNACGDSSMCLGVSFIAPRQLGAVGDNLGRQFLPSIEWRTGQSGVPPDSYCSLSGARFPSKLGTVDRCSSGPVGAPDGPVPLPTVGAATRRPWISRPTVGAGDRWLTGQSGAPPDSPVNYSHTPPSNPESGLFTVAQPGAPDTVRCASSS